MFHELDEESTSYLPTHQHAPLVLQLVSESYLEEWPAAVSASHKVCLPPRGEELDLDQVFTFSLWERGWS